MSARATAVDRERAQLVRELHDQVAHSVSQIHVHAGALEALHCADAAPSLAAIRVAATAAIHDLRRMHTVIEGDPVVRYRPQPDIHALCDLLDAVRRDGDGAAVDALARTAGAQAGPMAARDPVVPDSVAATAYRIARDVVDQLHGQPGSGLVDARIAVATGLLRVELALRWTALRPPRLALDLRRARLRTQMLGGTLRLRRDGGAAADRWTIRLTLPLDADAHDLDD